jgi:hypothetical protein
MQLYSFLFLGESDVPHTHKWKTNRASWTQEDLHSADEAYVEKTLSLRAARWFQSRGPIFYKLPIISLLALIIHARIICFVINMKYKKIMVP